MITDEHLQHLVAMDTDEPDSASAVDEKLAALNQFHRLSAVSCFGLSLLLIIIITITIIIGISSVACNKPFPVL